ncbi:ABC transporter permease [Microbacterium ulmi]|uniref:ABC transporter permease n=1 Tax=Microbacterium ulmi TaxID=179095 RepID=A0A7Y2M0A4_9MICO|nr:ABC transporter permease [Microbacterium ulmi]NII70613.1 multidrug/hemolysin transport system permease protein [Microbacterium ulmi]NNH04146.1 ABC transporter permease [Microbacterium ulmi]
MSIVAAIVARNLRIFFRDRLNVFFSLLGGIVLFGLYVLFLGNLQTQSLAASIPAATPQEVQAFVDSWMFAGIVLITTVTSGLGAMSVLVEDGETGRFRDFLVSPIRRGQLVLGYLISAIIVSLILSAFVFAVSVAYLGLVRGTWLPVDAVARAAGVVVLSCAAFTALISFVASFVRTSGAFAGLSTIVGTVLGFIAGAYIPVGLLPATAGDVVNALPFGQAGALLRQQFTVDTLPAMTGGFAEADESLRTFFGIDAIVGTWLVPPGVIVAILVAMVVVFASLSALRIRARIR